MRRKHTHTPVFRIFAVRNGRVSNEQKPGEGGYGPSLDNYRVAVGGQRVLVHDTRPENRDSSPTLSRFEMKRGAHCVSKMKRLKRFVSEKKRLKLLHVLKRDA